MLQQLEFGSEFLISAHEILHYDYYHIDGEERYQDIKRTEVQQRK
jgi:hypothetical protein